MVNKQLVEYVKTHHGRGHPFKQLHDHLVQHGHSSHEVNEAINTVKHGTHHPVHHPVHHEKIKPRLRQLRGFVLIVSIALILFVLALVFTFPGKGAIDCGTDFSCFIEASAGCNPAKVRFTTSADIFGMITSATMRIELRGMESGKCEYYDKQLSASVHFSDALVEQMFESGQTMEEINQNEQTATESIEQIGSVEKTCRFDTSDLKAMLQRWDEGTASGGVSCAITDGELTDCTFSGDFGNAECEIL